MFLIGSRSTIVRYFVLIVLFVFSAKAFAGKLDSFEEDAVKKTSQSRSNPSSSQNTGDSSGSCQDGGLFCDFFGSFLQFIGELIKAGGHYSFGRVAVSPGRSDEYYPGRDFQIEPRNLGEPLIPFVRLDLNLQPYSADVTATDMRMEAGYGPVALVYSNTAFNEFKSQDDMAISRLFGLYRMSFGPNFEIDFGLGRLYLSGNADSSYSYATIPIMLYPNKRYGIEYRPAWAQNISETDFAIVMNTDYAGLKFGYRESRAGGEVLANGYVGITVRY